MHELNSLTTQMRLDTMNGTGQGPRHVEFRFASAGPSSTRLLVKRLSDTLAWAQTKCWRSAAVEDAGNANSTQLVGENRRHAEA